MLAQDLSLWQLYNATIQTRSFLSYQSCKFASTTVADYYIQSGNEDYVKYAQRMLNCAPYMVLVPEQVESPAQVEFSEQGAKIIPHIQEARWCRVRHCPVCIKAKSNKYYAKLFKAVPQIREDNPTAQFLFLTLTIRKRPLAQLRNTVSELNAGWDRMTKRRIFPAAGFIRTFEVTPGNGLMPDGQQGAHAHFHVLMMVSADYFTRNYLTGDKWASIWQESMRLDYRPSVKIQKVRSSSGEEEGLGAAIAEVAKYCVKPADLIHSQEWLIGLTENLHKVRSITTGGEFRKYIKQNELDRIDEMQRVGDEVELSGPRFRVNWDDEKRRYVGENLGAMMVGAPCEKDNETLDFEDGMFD